MSLRISKKHQNKKEKVKKDKKQITEKKIGETEKEKLLQRVVDALTDQQITGDQIFSLAEECWNVGLAKQHDQLMAHAAIAKKHLRAAYVYASAKLEAEQSVEFLRQHCATPSPNPCCLTLLAQMMEDEECSLAFDAKVAGKLLERAIDRAKMLAMFEDKANRSVWELAALRATYEYVRYILNYKLDVPAHVMPWEVAQNAFAHICNDSVLLAFGATPQDMLDIQTLRGRIADAGGQRKKALDFYRLALTLARTTKQPTEFLLARIATLTPDANEARRLLPAAIAWLDDEGVGVSDKEMPDLVMCYGELCKDSRNAALKASMAERMAKLSGKSPLAQVQEVQKEEETLPETTTSAEPQKNDDNNMMKEDEATSETKTEAKNETKTEAKNEAKNETKTEAKNETKTEAKNETKTESETKSETKTESETKHEAMSVQKSKSVAVVVGDMTDSDWQLLPPLNVSFSLNKSLHTSANAMLDDDFVGTKRKHSFDDNETFYKDAKKPLYTFVK